MMQVRAIGMQGATDDDRRPRRFPGGTGRRRVPEMYSTNVS